MSRDMLHHATTIITPTDREILIERVFDGPRELVFQACTDPELIPQWWGPRRLTTTIEQMDVRPGGKWRFLQRDAEGNEFGFRGTYLEVMPPTRLVDTFVFDPYPDHTMVETLDLHDLGAATRMTVSAMYESREARDGMLSSGMAAGITESHQRLDELLVRMALR